MKKFIIVLMVVAAASFLLVGCLPGTTTPVTPVEPVEPVEPVVVTTVAPIITLITDNAVVPAAVISLTATTVYMNKAEVALGIIVNGTAPTYSEVKVYIDDICAGTADVGASGTFSVVIAKADLGADGEKTLYATAKEAAIAVSAKSVEYAFTLDTDLPGIEEVKATAAAVAGFTPATAVASTVAASSAITTDLTLVQADVEDGTWTIEVLDNAAAAAEVKITDPDGVATTYTTLAAGAVFLADAPIPGVSFQIKLAAGVAAAPVNTGAVTFTNVGAADTIVNAVAADFTGLAAGSVIIVTGSASNDGTYTIANHTVAGTLVLVAADSLTNEVAAIGAITVTASLLTAGQQTTIVCTARSAAIISRATLEFDEDVSITSAADGTYDFTANGVAVTAFTAELYVGNMVYWSAFIPALAPGDFFEALVSDVDDAAGNTITALSSATCTVGVASATALKP